mmetsp:Transcript_42762/g.50037  ORF Transcript_42762/g.50037 Transcript_42762/m.50037 type:complete len:84 (+) Transcript_42762:377-628(+)
MFRIKYICMCIGLMMEDAKIQFGLVFVRGPCRFYVSKDSGRIAYFQVPPSTPLFRELLKNGRSLSDLCRLSTVDEEKPVWSVS